MAENNNPGPIEPPKKFSIEDSDPASIPNSEQTTPEVTPKIVQQRIQAQKDNPLKNKKLWAMVGAGALGLALLTGGSYTVAKTLTLPSTEPTVITPEEGEKQADKLTKDPNKTTKPGTKVPEGKEGKTVGGIDSETNTPFVQGVKISQVKEVSLNNVGGQDYSGVFGDIGGRAFYVNVTLKADPKPAPGTPIPFGVIVSNDKTPVDTSVLNAVPMDHPDCTYGPKTWGEVKGNTAEKCLIVFTRDNEDLGDIYLSEENADGETQFKNPIIMEFKVKELGK